MFVKTKSGSSVDYTRGRYQYRSRLLYSTIIVVLHISVIFKMFAFLDLLKVKNRKGLQKSFLLMCLTRLWVLLLCISRSDGGIKATWLWVENICLRVDFSKIYCHNRRKNIDYPKQWSNGHLHHNEMDFYINIRGKMLLRSLTHISG